MNRGTESGVRLLKIFTGISQGLLLCCVPSWWIFQSSQIQLPIFFCLASIGSVVIKIAMKVDFSGIFKFSSFHTFSTTKFCRLNIELLSFWTFVRLLLEAIKVSRYLHSRCLNFRFPFSFLRCPYWRFLPVCKNNVGLFTKLNWNWATCMVKI